MKDFEYRDKIEGLFEGCVDLAESYIRTLSMFQCRPLRSLELLVKSEREPFLSPTAFVLISYLVFCGLLLTVDFRAAFFATDLSERLDAAGVLRATGTLEVRDLLLAVFPFLTFYVVSTVSTRFTAWLLRDPIPPEVLRRNVGYLIGGYLWTLGIVCAAYGPLVAPLTARSWWLGLPVHYLTWLLPSVTWLAPCYATYVYGDQHELEVMPRRVLVMSLPIALIIVISWAATGSLLVTNYLRMYH
jgi:hypothetical protein